MIGSTLSIFYNNTYLDPRIQYATELSNLITPNFTSSSTINFGLDGNLKIIKPSNGVHLMHFDNGGITIWSPLHCQFVLNSDDTIRDPYIHSQYGFATPSSVSCASLSGSAVS